MMIHDKEFGTIHVKTVEQPAEVKNTSYTHYTSTGTILMAYNPTLDVQPKDYYHLAVINDDGTGFHKVFEGEIPSIPKNNGIRFLPMTDNKRILTGDYVIECTPDIDHCVSSKLVRIHYNDELWEDRATMQSWTEIIMAPDAQHICWTTIRAGAGSLNFLGKLVRKEDAYYVEDAKIISDIGIFTMDQNGRPWPKQERNGELKQFVKGGSALSIASSNKPGTLDSMIQYFEKDEVEKVSDNISYEETAIFSPDEKLALCMSTRFSPGTNGEIFALCPRPLKTASTLGLSMVIYTYGVMDVRHHRHGNIGPVLVDIEKQQKDPSYMGLNLSSVDTDEEWVFSSPMSWHPNGKKVLWNEVVFGSALRGDHGIHRMRVAELVDYQPKKAVETRCTPEAVYGISVEMEDIRKMDADTPETVIPGLHSGRIVFSNIGRNGMTTLMGETRTVYENFSDDGINFWNGEEYVSYSVMSRNVYKADLEMTGEHTGAMHMQVIYEKNGPGTGTPFVVNRGNDENGNPLSYGYAEFDGRRLTVEDDIKD